MAAIRGRRAGALGGHAVTPRTFQFNERTREWICPKHILDDPHAQTLFWLRTCEEWRAKWQVASEQRNRLTLWLRLVTVGAIIGWMLVAWKVMR